MNGQMTKENRIIEKRRYGDNVWITNLQVAIRPSIMDKCKLQKDYDIQM